MNEEGLYEAAAEAAADAVYTGKDAAQFWSLICKLESAVLEHRRVQHIDPAPDGPDLLEVHDRLCQARSALVEAYARAVSRAAEPRR